MIPALANANVVTQSIVFYTYEKTKTVSVDVRPIDSNQFMTMVITKDPNY